MNYYNPTRRLAGEWGPRQGVLAHAKRGAFARPSSATVQPGPPARPARSSAAVPPPGDSITSKPPPPGGPPVQRPVERPVERGEAARPSAAIPPPGDSIHADTWNERDAGAILSYPPPPGGPPVERGEAARPSAEVPPPGDSREPRRPAEFSAFYGYR